MSQEQSSKGESHSRKISRSVFVAPKTLVKRSLSPVGQMYHSVADLRVASSSRGALEARLLEFSRILDNKETKQENDVTDDVAKPQYMAKSFAGLLATASVYAGIGEMENNKEDEDENSEIEAANDTKSVQETQSISDQTLFDVSVELNTDALSQLSTDSKSQKDIVRERLVKRLLSSPDERFVAEYPCWFLKDIMIQGHAYLTTKHLSFFAFLPSCDMNSQPFSGSLKLVSGGQLSKSQRYWAVLKGHTLTFYGSSTDLYFPLLTMDLRKVKSIQLVSNETNPEKFQVLFNDQYYILQADSFYYARHWTSVLKKQLFACQHAETDTMTVRIPLENVVDFEEDTIVDKSGTLRVRAVENSSTFAIDEYFFVFFKGNAETVKNKMTEVINNIELKESDDVVEFKQCDQKISVPQQAPEGEAGVEEEDKGTDKEKGEEKETGERMEDSVGEASLNELGLSESHKTNNLILSPLSSGLGYIRASSPLRVRRTLKSMADNLKLVSPNRLSKVDSDIVIEHYSPGTDTDDSSSLQKDTKSIISRFTPKRKLHTMSQMWNADPVHYKTQYFDSFFPEDDSYMANGQITEDSNERFREHFSFDESISLVASYHGYLNKNVPVYGKIYVSNKNVCFRSLLPGLSSKMILPFEDIENCYKETGFRFGYFGLVIVIQGHEELFMEFGNRNAREDIEFVVIKILDILSRVSPTKAKSKAEVARRLSEAANLRLLEEKISEQGFEVPLIVEENPYYTTVIKPNKAYRFGLLTIGSRGDVQPYIALAKGLMNEGHKVTIATHIEFKDWIISHEIGFKEVAGNPAELISLMVNHGSMNVGLLRDASMNFSHWITQLLDSAWTACQDIDILIESPSAMAGIHIAEALQIPYFRAFTMPWTRTRAYPHAFIVPDQKRGGSYNYFTHVLFENIFWKGISGKVNKWRIETLKLAKTNLVELQQNRVPFLYNVSPTVFPMSIDFNAWIKVTGYWFLDEKTEYKPTKELLAFINEARARNKKLVYIGFGSIVVSEPKKMTETIIKAVTDADVFCVLNKGWSDRFGDPDAKTVSVELPDHIFNSGDIPHDWLFPRIDAAVHHGGSGTTGASLRFGLPTIIKPFFGDQFFYASRVEDIGAGISLKKLNEGSLAKALKDATTNTRIIQRAKKIGETISSEQGVATAISCIYSELAYARSLIKKPDDSPDSDVTATGATTSKEPIDGDPWLLV